MKRLTPEMIRVIQYEQERRATYILPRKQPIGACVLPSELSFPIFKG
jgi:hypothetical protein